MVRRERMLLTEEGDRERDDEEASRQGFHPVKLSTPF